MQDKRGMGIPFLQESAWDETSPGAPLPFSPGLPPHGIVLVDDVENVPFLERQTGLRARNGIIVVWIVVKVCLNTYLEGKTHNEKKTHSEGHGALFRCCGQHARHESLSITLGNVYRCFLPGIPHISSASRTFYKTFGISCYIPLLIQSHMIPIYHGVPKCQRFPHITHQN